MAQTVRTIAQFCLPLPHNNHFPHIWRKRPFWTIVVVLVALQALSIVLLFGVPHTQLFGLISESTIFDLTNTSRATQNLPSLTWNNTLAQAAALKAEDMIQNNYFAHTSPSGKTPWYWFGQVGYKYYYAGENLAMNFNSSQAVNDAWLNSPSHRENIMDPHYTQIGIAARSGIINGQYTTVVVELFASPMPVTAPGPTSISQLFHSLQVSTSPSPILSPGTTISPVPTPSILGQGLSAALPSSSLPPSLAPAETTSPLAGTTSQPSGFWAYVGMIFNVSEKLPTIYSLIFLAVFILALLNVIIRAEIQHTEALARSGILMVIVLLLMLAQTGILHYFVPIIA